VKYNEVSERAAGLLTAPQAKRLSEIQFQLGGTNSLVDFGFVGAPSGAYDLLPRLKLTPAQATKIDAVLADATAKKRQLGPWFQFAAFPGGVETAEQEKARKEFQTKAADIERKAVADIVATFDAGQKAVWKENAGEPFDTTIVTAAIPLQLNRGFTGPDRQKVTAALTRYAQSRASAGEYAAALAGYDAVLRLAPTDAGARQSKASLLASCPSEWVRDGKQAVEIMQKLMTEIKEPTPGNYQVLAAALAETGQFDEAAKVQEKAIAALGAAQLPDDPSGGVIPGLKARYEDRLKLYRDKKPYRMPEPKDRGFGPGGQ
jgi:tetratricopeptide (TPR) repeat protein